MAIEAPGLAVASDKAIIAGRQNLERLSAFSVDYSPDQIALGTTVQIRVYSGQASKFNKTSNNYNTQNVNLKWASCVMDDHEKCTFGLSGLNVLQMDKDATWADGGKATGEALTSAILEKIEKTLTYSKRAAAISDWSPTVAKMAELVGVVADRGWAPGNCSLLLTPAAYGALLAELPASTYGGKDAIQLGYIPSLFGFRSVQMGTYISKADSISTNKGLGFVVPYQAVATGVRVPVCLEGTVENSGIGTDEITRLSIGYRVTADQGTGELNWTSEVLIGTALTAEQETGAPGFLQLVSA